MQRNVNYIFQMPCQLHRDVRIFWIDWYEEFSEFWPTTSIKFGVNVVLVCHCRCQKLFNLSFCNVWITRKGSNVTGPIVTRWKGAESLHLLSWGFIKWKLPFVKLRFVTTTISLFLLLLILLTQEDWWFLGSQVIFSSLVFHIFTRWTLIRTTST